MTQDNVQGEFLLFSPQDVANIDPDTLAGIDEAVELLGFSSRDEALENLPAIAAHIGIARVMQAALIYGFAALLLEDEEGDMDALSDYGIAYSAIYAQATMNVMNTNNLSINTFSVADFIADPPRMTDEDGEYRGPAQLANEIADEVRFIFDTKIYDPIAREQESLSKKIVKAIQDV